MFSSNRRADVVLAVVISICIGILFFLVWEASAEKAYQRAYAQYQTDARNQRSKNEDCSLRTSFSAVRECIINQENATRENKNSEYDLAAQEEMAYWTPWIFIGSIISAFLTLIGVVYVRLTLLETRRIGQTQVRAYLAVDGTDLKWRDSGDSKNPHQFGDLDISWKNFGQSPARKVGVFGHMKVIDLDKIGHPVAEWSGKVDAIVGESADVSIGEIIHVMGEENGDKWLSPDETTRFINGEVALLIYSAVKYRDVFDTTHVAEHCSRAVHFAADGDKKSVVKFMAYKHHNRDD